MDVNLSHSINQPWWEKRPSRLLFVAGIVGLSVLSFLLRLQAFSQTAFANGWDSYFYIIQVKSFLEEGQMHSTDRSFIYPFFIGLQWLVGDYEWSFKLGSALLAGLFTLVSSIFIWRRTASVSAILLVCAFLCFSPHLTYFASQYPKNLLGLVFFVGMLIFLFEERWMETLVFLVLCFFGHRMAFGLGVISLLVVASAKLPWKHWAVKAGIGLVVVVFIAGFFVRGLLSLYDLERFRGMLSAEIHWMPWTFYQAFGVEKMSWFWRVEFILGHLILLWISIQFLRKPNVVLGCLLALQFLLLFPLWKFSFDGMGYRLFLVVPLLWPLAFVSIRLNCFVSIGLSALFLIVASLSWKSYQPLKHDPPYALYQKVSEKSPVDKVELVIAHKALAEYFTFKTGVDALPWLPEYPLEKDKLWRITNGVDWTWLKNQAGPENRDKLKRLSVNYVWIREDVYQEVISKMGEGDVFYSEVRSWRNPYEVRPMYLLKGR